MLLGIPFLGMIIIVSTLWTILGIMLALHIVTLVFSLRDQTKIHGSILGIIASVLGWIPIIGWVIHLITGILLLVDAAKS